MDRKEKALELLKKLSEAHGAPGQENEVRRIFREELGGGGGITADRAGNIVCERTGSFKSPRIMLAAHMDEVGLIVQAITADGLIKFLPLGGWWAHTLLAQRVRIRTRDGDEIVGVVGAKPPHFLTEAERDKLMKIEDMFIDVGAGSSDDVRAFGIRLGDGIVPDSPFVRMRNPALLLSKAFDDRSGLALMIQAALEIENMPHPNTLLAVGTVQEEMGTRGARTAAFYIDPDLAVVIEGAPADDMPGTGREERQCVPGAGVQIRIMDSSAILNRKFVDFVLDTAEKHGIRHQVAVRRKGGTDAAPIQAHGAGVPTVVLAVPARYVHTHNTIIDISDYLSALELVLKLVETIDPDVSERLGRFE